MGSKQSSLATSPQEKKKDTLHGEFGRKSNKTTTTTTTTTTTKDDEHPLAGSIKERLSSIESNVFLTTKGSFQKVDLEEEDMRSDDEESLLTDTEDEYDSEEEEEDEDFAERLRILEDAKKLKALAVAFAHPELPVQVDPTTMGRNYFDRPSAEPVQEESREEAEERARVLADARALKKLAVDYAHPEIGVSTSDATVYGRNYFSRASAIEQEDAEEAEERARILVDATALKKLAIDYAHPELGVSTTDATSFGRNYFSRASAIEQEDSEEAEERARILADAAALKKLAVDYAHPEMAVKTVHPSAFGRNFFSTLSAPQEESIDDAEERARILTDAASLKKLAGDYLHPEVGVTTTDPTSFGRNYFTRPSAPLQEESAQPSTRTTTKKVESTKSVPFSKKDVASKASKNKVLQNMEDLSNMTRSPSAVVLYGLDEDNEAF